MISLIGKRFSVLLLPATPLVSVWDPWKDFKHPLSALKADPHHASWTTDYKDIVRCEELSAKVPGHYQEQLLQTLIVRMFQTH